MDSEDFGAGLIIASMLWIIIFTGAVGITDPEFKNCDIEIIDSNNDTLFMENVIVEFEGACDSYHGAPVNEYYPYNGDNIKITKNKVERNFDEADIKSMTLKFGIEKDGKH